MERPFGLAFRGVSRTTQPRSPGRGPIHGERTATTPCVRGSRRPTRLGMVAAAVSPLSLALNSIGHWARLRPRLSDAPRASRIGTALLTLACLAATTGLTGMPLAAASPLGGAHLNTRAPGSPSGSMTLASAPAALRSTVVRDLGVQKVPHQLGATYTSGGAQFSGPGFTFGVGAGTIGQRLGHYGSSHSSGAQD